jgi:Terpene synthase family 2, C-terminal metal binding
MTSFDDRASSDDDVDESRLLVHEDNVDLDKHPGQLTTVLARGDRLRRRASPGRSVPSRFLAKPVAGPVADRGVQHGIAVRDDADVSHRSGVVCRVQPQCDSKGGVMNSALEIPPLYCPFPDHVHPEADEIDRKSLRWLDGFGLIADPAVRARFGRSKIGWLASRTTPHADAELVQLLSDWQMWLFAFDDVRSEESEAGAHPGLMARSLVSYLRILQEPDTQVREEDPFTAALRDLPRRLGLVASQVQVDRFVTSVLGYWFAQVWEATNRADAVWPTVEEYTAMRVHTGAVPTCLALIDVVGRFELPAAELARHDVKALTTKAINVVCWANDIHSYEKEIARSNHPVNLPTLLHCRDGGTIQEAIDLAARMHDDEVAAYCDLRRRIAAGPKLERYLDGLQSWMRGNLTWSLSTGRYQHTPIQV